jgi:hypothetical protein
MKKYIMFGTAMVAGFAVAVVPDGDQNIWWRLWWLLQAGISYWIFMKHYPKVS